MSDRKRPRFGNPARQAAAGRQPGARSSVDPLSEFNRQARRTCSACGAPVEWVTGREAIERGVDLAAGMRFFGLTGIPGRDVWLCTSCDNFGIMEPGGAF